jgi:hypothetical protein
MLHRSLLLLLGVSGCLSQTPAKEEPQWAQCSFPADTLVNHAVVRVRVLVDVDGSPGQIEVVGFSERGEAFVPAARTCVRKFTFKKETDETGTPVRRWIPEFDVRFIR